MQQHREQRESHTTGCPMALHWFTFSEQNDPAYSSTSANSWRMASWKKAVKETPVWIVEINKLKETTHGAKCALNVLPGGNAMCAERIAFDCIFVFIIWITELHLRFSDKHITTFKVCQLMQQCCALFKSSISTFSEEIQNINQFNLKLTFFIFLNQ